VSRLRDSTCLWPQAVETLLDTVHSKGLEA